MPVILLQFRPTVRFEAKRNLPIIELPSFSSDATVASREHLSSDISNTSRPLAGTLELELELILSQMAQKPVLRG